MKNDKRMVAALHMASSKFNLPLLIEIRNLATSGSQRQVVRQSGIVIS